MNINIQGYLDIIHTPWGQLFYQMLWHHLPYEGKDILDFGSGFGITADHLAKCNRVTAIEPNEEMLAHCCSDYQYQQIIGGVEQLESIPNRSYDVIVCHNVLEYMDEREKLFRVFHRLLKENGTLSLVKHNRAGKVMQKAVFENQIDEAIGLLQNKNAMSVNFGEINEYSMSDLDQYVADLFDIDKIYGVRMFFGLQKNEYKSALDWMPKMFQIECAAEEIPEFRDIAFFHHIILKKTRSRAYQ